MITHRDRDCHTASESLRPLAQERGQLEVLVVHTPEGDTISHDLAITS